MKYLYRLLVLFVLILPYIACTRVAKRKSVQVNIAQLSYTLRADHGFVLADWQHPDKKSTVIAKQLCVSVHSGKIQVNKKPVPYKHLYIASRAGDMYIDGKLYTGSLVVTTQNKKLKVICLGGFVASKVVKPSATKIEKIVSNVRNQVQNTYGNKKPIINPLSCVIRVQLAKWQKGQSFWNLSSKNGFVIREINQKNTIFFSGSSELKINVCGNQLMLNGKKIKPQKIVITPKQGNITFQGNTYQGSFLLINTNDNTHLINNLELEDYVFSVLRTESWPGWPLEVNKVFAIACRTYAMRMVLNTNIEKQPYHVTNTNLYQTYAGIHSCPTIRKAVDQTRGTYLTYENKPIIAMFDSCCGGVIPAHIDDFDFAKAPYLARKHACKYCKRCKIYSWQASYDIKEFEKHVRVHMRPIHQLREIKVSSKDKAGLVSEVLVKGTGHKSPVAIPGKKLYSALSDVKSYCYQIHTKSGKIIIDGRGFGHHIGLCQWGAREMVRDGWDYQRILKFYYPGTNFMRLASK